MNQKPKLIRITTVPLSLFTLLKGQMRYMNNNDFDVLGVTSSGKELNDVIINEGVEVKIVEMTRQITILKDLQSVWNLYKLFRTEKPTIVHTHTPKAGIVGMLAAWLARVPNRLHTVAGLPLLVATGNKRKLLNAVETLTYKFATKVYPNSKGLYDIILKEKFTTPNKLKIIANGSSNGIDTNHFDANKMSKIDLQNLKNQYNITEKDFVFIFVGRIVGDKGINELATAFEKITQEYDNLKLLIVGDFERDLDPINKVAQDILNNNSNIVLTGFQKDVRPYLAIANALIFPSYREGFPNVVMQAGAMGLPSIVSDINGCNEIIIEGLNGNIIPVKDSEAIYHTMISYINDSNNFNFMKSNARKMICERYEQKVVWDALLNEYITLTNE